MYNLQGLVKQNREKVELLNYVYIFFVLIHAFLLYTGV